MSVTLAKASDATENVFEEFFRQVQIGLNFERLIQAVADGDVTHNGQYEQTALANAHYELDPLYSNDLNALAYVFSLQVA
ncbi:hypothetical protein ACWF99_23660 [Nocardia sp. NPDC055002]